MLYSVPCVGRRLFSAIKPDGHDELTQSWSEPCQSPVPQAQYGPVHSCTPGLQVTQNPLLPCRACIHINPGLWSLFLKQITNVRLSLMEQNRARCLSFWAQNPSRICSLTHTCRPHTCDGTLKNNQRQTSLVPTFSQYRIMS